MLGFNRNQLTDEDFEILLLISQSLKSDLPLPEAIRLALQGRKRGGRSQIAAFRRLAERVEKGESPEKAVYQVGLNRYTAGLFSTAIRSRDFAETFTELVHIEDSRHATTRKLRQALAYPVMLLTLFFIAGVIYFLYILPMFKDMYDSFGSKLPYATELLMSFASPTMSALLWFEIAFVIGLVYLCCRFVCPQVWFYIPLVGGIGKSLNQCSVMRQLAVQFLQGVSLHEALENCGKMVGNPGYRRDCRLAAHSARKGMLLQEIAMRYYWLFPPWIFPMLTPESTEEMLARSLQRAVETEETKILTSVGLLQSIIVPLFLLLILTTIGFTVIVLFIPMIQLITDMS